MTGSSDGMFNHATNMERFYFRLHKFMGTVGGYAKLPVEI